MQTTFAVRASFPARPFLKRASSLSAALTAKLRRRGGHPRHSGGRPQLSNRFPPRPGGINASSINQAIGNYNTNFAGKPTPAGEVLVQNNLFTPSELALANGVAPLVPTAPAGQVNYAWLKSFDFNLKWRYMIKERVTIEPSVNIFNLFNFANFDLPSNAITGLLTGPETGSVNGTTSVEHESYRVGRGTGVYALGAPRQTEFGLRIEF